MKYKQKLIGLRADQVRRLAKESAYQSVPANHLIRTALDRYFSELTVERMKLEHR